MSTNRYFPGQKAFLIRDVAETSTGPSVDAGTEVSILDVNGGVYLVETTVEQWDPGTGCNDDGSEGMRTSTLLCDDSDLSDPSRFLEDLINVRAEADELSGD